MELKNNGSSDEVINQYIEQMNDLFNVYFNILLLK